MNLDDAKQETAALWRDSIHAALDQAKENGYNLHIWNLDDLVDDLRLCDGWFRLCDRVKIRRHVQEWLWRN